VRTDRVDILAKAYILIPNLDLQWRNTMLGALAAIALAVGSVSATAVLTEDQRLAAEESNEAVVEVQSVEHVDTSEKGFGF
jgi:hypothetical protein